MRALGSCVLGLAMAACAGAPAPSETPQVSMTPPPAVPATLIPQAPPASDSRLCQIGWVAPWDEMSRMQIEAVLKAHGVSNNGYLMVPESQAAFAAEVLRAEGPRCGWWGLAEPYAEGSCPEPPPKEDAWPVLVSGISYEEALSRYPRDTPVGAVLRLPVARIYARVFPRLLRVRGFVRPYRDATLIERDGFQGDLVIGPGGSRPDVAFTIRFQSLPDGAGVPWRWWFHLPMVGAIPEPGPGHAPWSAVVEVNWTDPASEGWVLETLDGADIAAFPLPESQAKNKDNGGQRYAVPAADAKRARDLLRANKPTWVNLVVVEEE